MNDRLEIASRLMALYTDHEGRPTTTLCLEVADALIAEEARTRQPAGDAPDVTAALRQLEGAAGDYAEFHGGCQHHPDDCPGKDEECVVRVELRKAFDAAKQALAAKPLRVDAPAPDAELRAVAEELAKTARMTVALHMPGVCDAEYDRIHKNCGWDGVEDRTDFRYNQAQAALRRARAIGLGGGK